jgi:glycosyltransferase involved in cell wall biosynthesis
MKFSIFMIVKDEEECIEKALKSTKGVEELVVCIDDRTTDKTEEIARKYTDKIYKFKWEDDFAGAKNFASSKCKGEYVMSLDGDCYLEEGFLDKVNEMLKTPQDAYYVELESVKFGMKHNRAKIYRNNGKIFYKGMAHEDLNVLGKAHPILPKIYYGYSINHSKDPERYTRILTKQIEKDPNNPRWYFYLGQSHFDKRRYNEALEVFEKYLKLSKYLNEIVEAQFMMAKSYWYTQRGNQAREIITKALLNNPDHKGVLNLLAELYYEPQKSKWKQIASRATNKDVMFKI